MILLFYSQFANTVAQGVWSTAVIITQTQILFQTEIQILTSWWADHSRFVLSEQQNRRYILHFSRDCLGIVLKIAK